MAPQVVQYPRATSLTTHSSRTTGVEGAGGSGGRKRAWPRCRWAAAGPGWASRRRITTQHRRRRRCGGRRRVRRARAGFEIDHSEPQARVWRSRGRLDPTAPGTPAEPQATSLTTHSSRTTGVEGAGGSGGRKRAWLRCPWAAAGPGWASRRRAEPRISDQAPPVWRAPEGPEGTGGLRDRPLRAFRLACGDLAGGRTRRCPEHHRRRKHRTRSGGAASTAGDQARLQAPLEIRTPRSTPGSGRPGGRRGARAR